ncbi:DUF262 domain-containing protein [Prosthecomicrobium hirschii]|uniref:DUF262 domain-containing protein n=1 Tax=Prosthecodimorpha hirschii TaxID=665126 RepID=UPI00221F8E82|nr:DUF262 domain-containing protein [Prosthecomicrobium hirschii]MCW1842309.1 DUF262 domain-containing protein [Prosthecomicrobium hirschii]
MINRPSRITDEMISAGEAAIESIEISVKFLVTDFTVEFLATKVREEEYYVPPYQRELVWKNVMQSRFIESVLIGLPIPFLFFWQANDGRLEIVDGSQRLRTLLRFLDGELKLKGLDLIQSLEGFSFNDLTKSRQRKFSSRVIRGIVLDNSVDEATRTEMFNRINTGGTKANEAEVRRGSLPGKMTDLISEMALFDKFVELTPISDELVKSREREELIVRFFAFLESARIDNNCIVIEGWQDRPRDFIFSFVKHANKIAEERPDYIASLRIEFEAMIDFVKRNFRTGFRKSISGTQIPRVRFEAIAVGVGLALRTRPELATEVISTEQWIDSDDFRKITTSDAANVKSKVLGRINFVYERVCNHD